MCYEAHMKVIPSIKPLVARHGKDKSATHQTSFAIVVLCWVLLVGWMILFATPVWAGLQAKDIVKKGTVELGLQTGYWHAVTGLGNAGSSNREAIFVLPQIGYVLSDAFEAGYFSGAFEVILEPVGAHFVDPFSASLFGGSLIGRYNFLSFGQFMPYWDMGAGMVWTDLAPRIPEQSTQFEFILHAGPGIHYLWFESEEMVSSLSLGLKLHHISNANIGKRNTGINAILGLVGVSFYFPN